VQVRVSGADDRQRVRRAGSSLGGARKRGSSGRKSDSRRGGEAGAVEDQGLRSAGSVVCDLKVGGERTQNLREKNRTTPPLSGCA